MKSANTTSATADAKGETPPGRVSDDRREDLVRLPGRSQASRTPSLRSKGSHRGSLLSGLSDRAMLYESKLEADVLLCLMARPDVVALEEQPEPIVHFDREGRERKTTFDALATLADGRRVLIAVKPRDKALRNDFHAEIAHIGAQVPLRIATHVVVVDEFDAPRDAVRDAALFHAVRRDGPSAADGAIEALTASMEGAASVSALIEASGLGALGFRAIVRLVADGVLVKTGSGPLTRASMVKRAGNGRRAA